MQHGHKNIATETLYVGNLAFDTTPKDLNKAIRWYMGHIAIVEEITIPCINGKSKYGFIKLSWHKSGMKDTADLLTYYSRITSVNERRIYFRKLRDKGNKQ